AAMNSLKEALARVSRVVNPPGPRRRPPPVVVPAPPAAPRHLQLGERPTVPRPQLAAARPHVQRFLRRRFQRFLEPLQMPQLRIHEDRRAPYDAARAERRLAHKSSADRLQMLTYFLGERPAFERMMRLLEAHTPRELMDGATVESPAALARVLEREDREFHAARYAHVPRFHFREVPPMPRPLTRAGFQEYVYTLTHSRMLYRNALSLKSGLVPEILLYTHRVDNEAFRPFRSTETYNYLIKYFGFDKFQSSFARELVLVMVHDGHAPNTNTLNQLLRICRVHSRRRSLVSTYKLVANYLGLARKLGLRINLATWNRVYDCIDNILLKEAFLNRMLAVCLPVLDNMCVRVLADFCTTTSHTQEVVRFLENDLRRPAWRDAPRLAEKVLFHQVQHTAANADLARVFEDFGRHVAVDALTLKTLANAINANANLLHRGYLVLCMYVRLAPLVPLVPPEVYSRAAQLLCENAEGYDIPAVNFFVRAIVHHDATRMLGLPPTEPKMDFKTEETRDSKKQARGPRLKSPDAVFPENYKIFKRLSRKGLNVLEAKVIYELQERPNPGSRYPWDLLTESEEKAWVAITEQIRAQSRFWENTAAKAASVGLVVSDHPQAPPAWITAYEKKQYRQMSLSHEINTLQKLAMGLDKHTEHEMKKRNIYAASPEQTSV
ncbi:hypothetical protein METBIDRAFT_46102, partial [Metschnikowia bicuspidata var. bicuspidata NRRL YB-4993]